MKKFQMLWLLSVCFARAVFYGTARRAPSVPKNICVIQMAKLGDMVCTTPMFSAIRRKYPDAQVCVVGDVVNRELLAGHPDISEYLVWNKMPFSMAQLLRQRQFDAVCITSPNTEALATAYLAGIPCIVVPHVLGGTSPYETRSYKILRTLAITIPHTMGQYAPREYLRLLEPLGIESSDTTKTIAISSSAKEKALAYISTIRNGASRVIGISPAAGNKIKQWPPERFAAVADYLVERHSSTVIVFGGSKDHEEVGAMMQVVRHAESVHNTQGTLSIEELKALVSRLDLFISVDTGPIYIAEACKVPTIDIVGPMDEREQPPRGLLHEVVVPPRTAPQLHIMNARAYDKEEALRQVESIKVEQVLQSIDSILAKI